MNPGVYGPLDSATNLYTGLPINKQMVSTFVKRPGSALINQKCAGDGFFGGGHCLHGLVKTAVNGAY